MPHIALKGPLQDIRIMFLNILWLQTLTLIQSSNCKVICLVWQSLTFEFKSNVQMQVI